MNQNNKRTFVAKVVRSAGALASDPKEAIKVMADMVADKIEGNAKASLIAGLEYLNKKGSIEPNFVDYLENRHFLIKIMADFNTYISDESKLLRKINLFLGIVSGEIGADSIELRRIWKLVDGLNEQEFVLLAACYKLYKKAKEEGKALYEPDAAAWLQMMAEESGLKHKEFAEEAENQLINDWLLQKRLDNNQVKVEINHRLTDLGILVSELLEKGEKASGQTI